MLLSKVLIFEKHASYYLIVMTTFNLLILKLRQFNHRPSNDIWQARIRSIKALAICFVIIYRIFSSWTCKSLVFVATCLISNTAVHTQTYLFWFYQFVGITKVDGSYMTVHNLWLPKDGVARDSVICCGNLHLNVNSFITMLRLLFSPKTFFYINHIRIFTSNLTSHSYNINNLY